MKTSNVVYGKFSDIGGTGVRHVYDAAGNLRGVIRKKEAGGYRIYRVDGKVRDKEKLQDAFASIKRQN